MKLDTYEIAVENDGSLTLSGENRRKNGQARRWKIARTLPQLDGEAIEPVRFEVHTRTDDEIAIDYDTHRGTVHLTIQRLDGRTCLWKMTVRGFPDGMTWQQASPFWSSSLHGFDAAYRSGRYGWEQAEIHPLGGSAIWKSDSLLGLSAGHWLLIGFVTHTNCFTHFDYAADNAPLDWVRAACEWENAGTRQPASQLATEEMVIIENPYLEGALARWADITAGKMNARVRPENVIAFDSWYRDFDHGTHQRCIDVLLAMAGERDLLPFTHFIIGMGWHANLGDWLDPNPAYGAPVVQTIAEIRRAGLKPGLWFAPFMIGNRSSVFAAHPDWVARKADGLPHAVCSSYGEPRLWFGNEEIYAADPTDPGFLDYIGRCVRTFREEWGVDLLRLDFCHYGCLQDSIYGRAGITHAQAYRRALNVIREAFGEGFILACSAPLNASVGLIDGCRVNAETGPEWRGWYDSASAMSDALARAHLHRRFWLNDAGAAVVRDYFSRLDPDEVRSRGLLQSVTAGVFSTGDDLRLLSPDRRDLLRFLMPIQGSPCEIIEHDLHQVAVLRKTTLIGSQAFVMLAAVNLTDDERAVEIDLVRHGLTRTYHVFDLWEQVYAGRLRGTVRTVLTAHGSALFALTESMGAAAEVVCSSSHVTGAEDIDAIVYTDDSIQITPRRAECRAVIFAAEGIDAPDGLTLRDCGRGA